MEMLARRERLEAEIRTALERREFEPAVVESVVAELRAKGYLNDDRAIRNAVDYSAIERQEGPLKIHAKLLSRGAAEEAITDALATITSEEQLAFAVGLLEKRRNWKDPAQAARFLAAKGYDEETVEAALALRFDIETEAGEC
ncbi:MAG: Regulatory protein RecX [Fimbriimonadaceae bacterium]|nr:Regulatory protein RecX [Fimbriimonadaceae bacterium]